KMSVYQQINILDKNVKFMISRVEKISQQLINIVPRTKNDSLNNHLEQNVFIELNERHYAYGQWAIRMKPLPNGFIACGFKDGAIRIFDPISVSYLKKLMAHTDTVWDFSVLGKHLISVSEDKSIRMWNLSD